MRPELFPSPPPVSRDLKANAGCDRGVVRSSALLAKARTPNPRTLFVFAFGGAAGVEVCCRNEFDAGIGEADAAFFVEGGEGAFEGVFADIEFGADRVGR